MDIQAILHYSAQTLKEFSSQSGYEVSDILAAARPIIFEIAADKGIKIVLSDLNDLEKIIASLDAPSNVVNFKNKRSPASSAYSGPKKQNDPLELRILIQKLIEQIFDQLQTGLSNSLPRAKSKDWAHQYKVAADGSFGSFLKSQVKATPAKKRY